jgi:oxalate decarboxylase/phosphoglucose isomerase-like protein (cupin superfamily)
MNEQTDLPYIATDNRTFYEQWQEAEGLDVIQGMFVEDLRALPLKPWKRKGGSGVFINLEGAGEENTAYVCEIPPGGSLLPQRHLFEETIFILDGIGSTMVWNEGEPKQSFEWQFGSLFAIPLNSYHQHFNGQGDKPARYVAVTMALPMMNLFYNEDFIFNNPFHFKDRFQGEKDYFAGEGKWFMQKESKMKIWETNFVSDVAKRDLVEWKERGGGGRSLMFQLSESCMPAHVSQFSVGAYKKAHRHVSGANVIILNGEGFTLMWQEGQPFQRYDWKPGSIIVPPDMWFHQHFNIGKEPAMYLALHGKYSPKYKTTQRTYWGVDTDVKKGGDQIEYEDEDPAIREMFEKELAKRGVQSQMSKIGEKK